MPTAPLTSASDDELVASFRAGGDDAFAEIYRRHRGALRSFAERVLRDLRSDADDVVQESFIRARRGLRANDRPVALRPWLYMIVRNCAIDELRARRHIATLDDDHELSTIATLDVAQHAELAQSCTRSSRSSASCHSASGWRSCCVSSMTAHTSRPRNYSKRRCRRRSRSSAAPAPH